MHYNVSEILKFPPRRVSPYVGALFSHQEILLQPHFIMLALGVFILIHSIGIFTNIALNGTLTLFADIALSRLRPIQLLSKSIQKIVESVEADLGLYLQVELMCH